MTKDGRNLFDFMPEPQLREIVVEGKKLAKSTALSGHLRLEDLDELARINPDIVGVRGAVCQMGDRSSGVHRDAVANFKRELNLRETGQIEVRETDTALSDDGWVVIDGTGKTCAGILAALTSQIGQDSKSFIEVIIPDVLNSYDVVLWAEEGEHSVVTQRKDQSGAMRILIRP